MERMSSMRMQSLVEIGGRMATWEMKNIAGFCLYVCMFLSRWMSTTYNVTVLDQFKCGFHSFYIKKGAFRLSAEISAISLGGATIFKNW